MQFMNNMSCEQKIKMHLNDIEQKINIHLNDIERWKTEAVQLSKQDIVHELYTRTTPIFRTLLQTIQWQQERISKLEEQLQSM